MQEELIYKLKALQSIEPEAAWRLEKKRMLMEKASGFGVQNDVFQSQSGIYAKKESFSLMSLFPNRLAVAFTSLAVFLTGSALTVGASQSSLPGEPLYAVKRMGEKVALAVAPEEEKPRLEIEMAGKRLEELALVSQKASDSAQHEKVNQLLEEFRENVDQANNHLNQLNGRKTDGAVNTRVADVAQVVTEQSEKYADVLQKTTQSLPAQVQERVAGQVADATKTTEKVNIAALMVMVDNQRDEEVAAIVQKTVEKAEVRLNGIAEKATTAAATPTTTTTTTSTDNSGAVTTSTTQQAKPDEVKQTEANNAAFAEEALKEMERAKENLNNNNLMDTLKSVMAVTEITEKVGTDIGTPASIEPVPEAPLPAPATTTPQSAK
jgi:hypothetical protein